MRWLVVIALGMATVATVGASLRLNYLFGASLGQTPEKAQTFAWLSVAIDVWKAFAPVMMHALWRAERRTAATAVLVVWVPCLLYSVSSGLAMAVQDRLAVTGGRETLRAGYEDVRRELEDVERQRNALQAHRSRGEVEAAIGALLARPVRGERRVQGTVDSVSRGCTKADGRTVEVCAQVAALRQELAVSVEAVRLDERISELHRQLGNYRERGGALSVNPLGELLSRLTMGSLSAGDSHFALALLMMTVIELISAGGPATLSAYVDMGERNSGAGSPATKPSPLHAVTIRPLEAAPDCSPAIEHQPVGQVIDYMAERIEPASTTAGVAADELHAEYRVWCNEAALRSLSFEEFIGAFEGICRQHLQDKVRKEGDGYVGLVLLTKRQVLARERPSTRRQGKARREL